MSSMRFPVSIFISLFLVLFLVIFDYAITLTSAIYTVSDLGGSGFMSNYATSFYALGNALGVPLGRSFSDKVGPIRLLIICLSLFGFFSGMCALSSTFFFFVAFRFIQGIVGGPFYTLLNRLFALLTPQGKETLFTSITLTIFTVGPVLGASFGGWIAYDYIWQWAFYINIPLSIFLSFFLRKKLKNLAVPPLNRTFDSVGYFFYFVSVFSLGFVFITGQEFDWFRSPLINAFFGIGIFTTLFFLPWSYFHPDPIVNFRFLKNPSVAFGLIYLAVLFSAYFGMVILLSLWLNLYVNYTPLWIAVLIGTMALAGLFPTFLMMNRIGLMDCRFPLIIALIFLAYSCFHTALFNVEINFERIASSRIFAGVGLALFLPPIFRLCFHSIPKEKGLDMVILFQFVRALSSGIGSALYSILWQRRVVFFHERLGEKLTVFSAPTRNFFTQAHHFHLAGNKAAAQLNVYLERQATSLALDDCFYFMGIVMIGLGLLTLISFSLKKEIFCPEKKLS